jgi:acetyl/propionyl-CoA carboxylase alpha subunit
MVRALTEYDLRGISTTIGFCRDLVRSPAFAAAEFDTTFVDRLLEQNGHKKSAKTGESEEIVAIAAAMWATREAGLKATTTTGPETIDVETPPVVEMPSVAEPPIAVETRTVAPTFRAAKPAESLWARRGRWESLR